MNTDHDPTRCRRRLCYADPCKPRTNARVREITRLKAYRRWHPWVPADPVREHVDRLRESGLSLNSICAAAGMSKNGLAALRYGVNGRPPTTKVYPETARKLLAVRADAALLSAQTVVDATGTRRRLQALAVLGWSQPRLAARLGIATDHLSCIVRGRIERVKSSTAAAARDLYDELWNTPPTGLNPVENSAIRRARNAAVARGWAPPMAWDDDSIDDPGAEPDGIAAPSSYRKLPQGSELLWLVDDLEETHEAIAQRFDAHIKTVKSAVIRARRKSAQQEVSA